MPHPLIPRSASTLAPALGVVLLFAGCGAGGSAPTSPSAAHSPQRLGEAQATPEPAASSEAGRWRRIKPPPEVPSDRPLAAGFLIVDGVYNTELTAPYDILHHTRFHTSPGIEVFTVSPDGRPVESFEGLRIAADHSFADAPPIDILVVPSAEGSMDRDLDDDELIAWVRTVGGEAMYVMSLCDGAFVLAKAGLLDERAVTTFPGDYHRFAQMFPGLDLRVNVSFVRDGNVLTSQGGARSFDVAMHLVDLLYGQEVAAAIGRGMMIPWPPRPGQAPAAVVEVRPADRP